jgi:protein-tyrosine phosphatase
MFYLPIILAFNSKLNKNDSKKLNFFEILNILIDIIFIIDIPLNFFTAYYNNIDERLITINPNISYNYLSGYFFFDLISAIPFNTLFDLKIIDKFSNKILPDYYNKIYTFRITRLLKSFKILTDNSFIKFLDKICNDYYNYTNFEKTFRLSLTLYICLFSFHLFGSIFIFIGYNDYPNWITESKIDPKSYYEIYICSIYFVCSTLFNIGYGDIHGYNLKERIFGLFLLIISVIIYSWIVSTLSKYYVEGDDKTQILKQKLYLLEDIKIQYNNMSYQLYEKIKRFLLYKKENDTKDFSLIYNDLPLMLRNNLIYEMYKPIINNFIFFKNFDNQDFIIKVILSLKPLFAVKGERLITERDFVDEIIFVKNGKLVLEFPLPIILQNSPIKNANYNILEQKTGTRNFTIDNFDLRRTSMFKNTSKLKTFATRNSIINTNNNNNNNNNIFKVSLFPSLDHNPCSVKLILEFCIDIILFLTNNIESIAAVHCKAGKGRTGVMICSYLIFSNLCENSENAIKYYGKMRTLNEKGVTIPSQIRYIKYFETFLNANYYKPFYFLIPKIIKEHLFIDNKIPVIKNLLINLENDSRYYTTPDYFKINYIKIGPFECEKNINVEIQNFTGKNFDLKCFQKLFKKDENIFDKFNLFFYFVNNNDDDVFPIHSDIKIIIKKDVNFYICLNLWFDSLNKINNFLLNDDNNDLKQRKKSFCDILKNEEIKNSKENFNIKKIDYFNNNKLKNGFLIFDENDFEITKNSFNKEIESFFQENNNNNNNKSFNSILNYIHHYDELNNIINIINKNRKKQNKKIFNKNNISIQFGIKQFDKFKEKKDKKYENIFFEINYSIK